MTFRDKLSSIAGRCPRATWRVLGTGCAVSLALAPLVGMTSANAVTTGKPLTEVSLFGGGAKLTVGGHTWSVSVAAEAPLIAGEPYSVVIGVSTAHEEDGWVFETTPKADVSASASTGAFSLDSHSAFEPVASVNVKFKATSHKAESCSKGSETSFTGTMTGSVTLVANSSKGLVFKVANAKFSASRVLVDRGCVPKGNPCSAGIWGADGKFGSGGGLIVAAGETPGLPGQRTFDVTVGDDFPLPSPAGAFEDIIIYQKAKSTSYDSKHKKLSVEAGSGRITGSVVLTSLKQFKPTFSKCTISGKSYKETDVSYNASFTSPAGQAIQTKSYIIGAIKLPTSGTGEFDISTFKKA
jgi:hypothetical protein